MDDYSRFILAWELKPDMTVTSLIDVVQKALDFTGMAAVPVEDRTALLSYRRYHEGLGDVIPYDVYTGKHLEIIQRRKEAKNRTFQIRRDYSRTARKQGNNL